MKKTLLLLLIVSFTMVMLWAVDESLNEPANNNYSTTTDIASTMTSYNGALKKDSNLDLTDVYDYWKIPFGSSGDLTITLTSVSNSNVKIWIGLYVSDTENGVPTLSGTEINLSSAPNSITTTLSPLKAYYIVMKNSNSLTTLYNYTFTLSGAATLPVELSSFTAVLSSTNNVSLAWTSQSESNLSGYNVFRNNSNDQQTAVKVNPTTIVATNTSTEANYNFTDANVEAGEYYYWLQSVEQNNETNFHGPVYVNYVNNPGTPDPQYQYKHRLLGAYPNPFNPNTSIRYEVQGPTTVSINIFNSLGQKVASYSKTHSVKGTDSFNWNGKDFNGKTVSTGVYFSTMNAGKYQDTKKMIMMK